MATIREKRDPLRTSTLLLACWIGTCLLTIPSLGQGFGQGRRNDPRRAADQELFHFLLAHHDKITRQVTELPNGVKAVTESDDPEVVEKLQEHVEWMAVRIEKSQPIRMRDPLFRELFKNADKIELEHEMTDKGVIVTEWSDDPHVVKLIQAHAKVVSGFVASGFAEAAKNHPVPASNDEQQSEPKAAPIALTHPSIAKYGAVVRLPDATQQPRAGTKLCVDLTAGSEPAELNVAIEKLARYVNIFAGAGREPVPANLVVVLHGEATLAALNNETYSQKFQTDGNPNAKLMKELHSQGVKFYVCGQSLIGKGARPDQALEFVDVAVSALTAVVNHQMDGYSVVQLD